MAVLAAFVAARGSMSGAAELVGIRPSTAKRHLADLRAKSGLSTEQLIYAGRAAADSARLLMPFSTRAGLDFHDRTSCCMAHRAAAARVDTLIFV